MHATRGLVGAALALGLVLAAGPARAEKPIDLSKHRDELVVLHDGHGHYAVALQERSWKGPKAFYGDGKTFHALRDTGGSADASRGRWSRTLWEPRIKKSSELLRIRDTWQARCGKRKVPLVVVGDAEREKILAKAVFLPAFWKRTSTQLGRDEQGVYYYVDALRQSFGEEDVLRGVRLFVGRRGAMKEQRLVDVVSDSGGAIFIAKNGKWRVDLITRNGQREYSSTWVRGKKRTKVDVISTYQNQTLIYSGLGVYDERIGTLCEDL